MQRGRGCRDDFFCFSDPFGGFGGFKGPGSLMSSFFDGRDPFDDPFFGRPLPGRSMFVHRGRPFGGNSDAGFLYQASPANRPTRPVIEELSSDDEGEGENAGAKVKGERPRRPSRSSQEPYVQDPDEEAEGNKRGHIHFSNAHSRSNTMRPQGCRCYFRSSTVTYGGPNGAYYTSSTVRRTGGDGVSVEESKEADTTTGKATHRIYRGIGGKGHTVMRKLSSNGRVDTMQTLHDLNEDELPGFEQAWKGKAHQHLPGWNSGLDSNNARRGNSSRQEHAMGWALPSTERPHEFGRPRSQAGAGFPSIRSSVW